CDSPADAERPVCGGPCASATPGATRKTASIAMAAAANIAKDSVRERIFIRGFISHPRKLAVAGKISSTGGRSFGVCVTVSDFRQHAFNRAVTPAKPERL